MATRKGQWMLRGTGSKPNNRIWWKRNFSFSTSDEAARRQEQGQLAEELGLFIRACQQAPSARANDRCWMRSSVRKTCWIHGRTSCWFQSASRATAVREKYGYCSGAPPPTQPGGPPKTTAKGWMHLKLLSLSWHLPDACPHDTCPDF
jgi:hypothetical protein